MNSSITEAPMPLPEPCSSWLVRPLEPRAGERYRFRVRTSDGLGFVTGVSPSPSGEGYEAALEDLAWAPYSGFGAFDTARVGAGGADAAPPAPALRRRAVPAER